MPIPDYSDLTFSVKDMQKFLKDGNFNIGKKELKQLNTIFNQYDKINPKGENKPDGELGLNEDREAFKEQLEKQMPGLFDKLVEFFIVIDLIEENRQLEDAKKQFENNNKRLDTKS